MIMKEMEKGHDAAMKRDNRKFNVYSIPVEYETVVEEVSLEKGAKVIKLSKVTKKLGQDYKDLHWYDFSIDSLSAVGALEGLKRMNLDGNILDIADEIDKNIEEE